MTDSEDNQVGGFYPGAMADSQTLTLERWAGQEVLVCVSAHDPEAMRAQTDECRELKLPLVYDPGQQVSNSPAEDLKAGTDAAEVLIVNDYELSVLCDRIGAAQKEIQAKVPALVTTLGKQGSVISGTKAGKPIEVPAAKPDKLVDPTGAGDAYRAGFLYGYLRQWQLRDCGRLGAVLASFIIEQHGTQTEISKDALAKRYRETFNEEVTL
jgi:adenosine kinase